jgi:hypothetical protein
MGEIEPLRYRGIVAPCMPLPCLFLRSLQAGTYPLASLVIGCDVEAITIVTN